MTLRMPSGSDVVARTASEVMGRDPKARKAILRNFLVFTYMIWVVVSSATL